MIGEDVYRIMQKLERTNIYRYAYDTNIHNSHCAKANLYSNSISLIIFIKICFCINI